MQSIATASHNRFVLDACLILWCSSPPCRSCTQHGQTDMPHRCRGPNRGTKCTAGKNGRPCQVSTDYSQCLACNPCRTVDRGAPGRSVKRSAQVYDQDKEHICLEAADKTHVRKRPARAADILKPAETLSAGKRGIQKGHHTYDHGKDDSPLHGSGRQQCEDVGSSGSRSTVPSEESKDPHPGISRGCSAGSLPAKQGKENALREETENPRTPRSQEGYSQPGRPDLIQGHTIPSAIPNGQQGSGQSRQGAPTEGYRPLFASHRTPSWFQCQRLVYI